MQTKYRAYICCGRNCGPKGSVALLDALEAEVEQASIADRVQVLPTGCQAHCESGPTMVIYPGPVYYQEISRDKLRRIVQEHFIEGRPVADYFWTGIAKRLGDEKRAAVGVVQATRPVAERPQPRKPEKRERPKRSYEDVDDFKW